MFPLGVYLVSRLDGPWNISTFKFNFEELAHDFPKWLSRWLSPPAVYMGSNVAIPLSALAVVFFTMIILQRGVNRGQNSGFLWGSNITMEIKDLSHSARYSRRFERWDQCYPLMQGLRSDDQCIPIAWIAPNFPSCESSKGEMQKSEPFNQPVQNLVPCCPHNPKWNTPSNLGLLQAPKSVTPELSSKEWGGHIQNSGSLHPQNNSVHRAHAGTVKNSVWFRHSWAQ